MSKSVSVGLMIANRGPVMGITTVPDILDLAEAAEDSGWDSIWVGDSFLAKPRVESIVLLAAIAARTSSVLLGPACMASTPLRNPLLMAYQWASLDLLANGRTVFAACQGGGPGSGEFDHELTALGVDRSSRTRRMEEAIEILRLVWSEGNASYAGTYTSFSDVTVLPRPAQKRIPIWLAANPDMTKPKNVNSAYRRVAAYADGWQTTHTSPDDVARSLDIIQQHADALGRSLPNGFEVCVCSNICLGKTRAEALAEAKRFLDDHSMTNYSPGFLERWVAAGKPDDCIRYLDNFRKAGASTILLRISCRDQRSQFERITQEVLPALKTLALDR